MLTIALYCVMASVKNVMQKEIFLPNDEKLLAVISVTKPTGRKKKPSFLALSGRTSIISLVTGVTLCPF